MTNRTKAEPNTKCWNNCKAPAIATISGQSICAECFDHYMGYDRPTIERPEYVTADHASDLRGF